MAVYFEIYMKQTNTLWENSSYLLRVKREGSQLTFKGRLAFKIIFPALRQRYSAVLPF